MMILLLLFFACLFLFGVSLYLYIDMQSENQISLGSYEEEKTRFTEEDYKFKICYKNN